MEPAKIVKNILEDQKMANHAYKIHVMKEKFIMKMAHVKNVQVTKDLLKMVMNA